MIISVGVLRFTESVEVITVQITFTKKRSIVQNGPLCVRGVAITRNKCVRTSKKFADEECTDRMDMCKWDTSKN